MGKVKIVRSTRDLEDWRKSASEPSIMVLPQSMSDAAGWLPGFEGVVVDLGNPADHLACVAREYSRPMLTGTGKATEVLKDGQWVILDADRAMVLKAPEEVWSGIALTQREKTLPEDRRAKRNDVSRPETIPAAAVDRALKPDRCLRSNIFRPGMPLAPRPHTLHA